MPFNYILRLEADIFKPTHVRRQEKMKKKRTDPGVLLDMEKR
jgi:hypothetical protein